ncbi:MAG TPA: hypothetical protein VGC42_06785, partial [Kofleriaceae bacterium]
SGNFNWEDVMSVYKLARCVGLSVLAVVGCGPSHSEVDAPPVSTVPDSPAGTFEVTSAFDIPVPVAAAPIIEQLTAATDGPDDPSRYLLDRMIETLPDGTIRTLASDAAPYVAAYLDTKLSAIAPRFVPGITQLAAGLDRIASHLAMQERWVIDDAGATTRTITALRFELGDRTTTVALADAGLAIPAMTTHAGFTAGAELAVADHMHALPYGAWLRLGLDLAVVPRAVPGAHDLGEALASLLDCDALGALIGAKLASQLLIDVGPVFATACRTAMTLVASKIDAQLAAIDHTAMALEVSGDARGVDLDGDGSMDQLAAGNWTGSLHDGGAGEAISAGQFTGVKAATASPADRSR